ncbi:MAG: AI-2E family transporter [Pirellulaceae bacterium]|nr:AI-2E family transporter [Pirellulaceae bacterium]
MSRLVSFAVLIGILVVIVVLFYQVMAVFLLPLFMAALLGVVFQPLYRWTLERFWKNRYAAAGVTTFLVLVVVLAPAGLVITMAAKQSIDVMERVQATDVAGKAKKLRQDLDLDIPNKIELHQFEAVLKNWRGQQSLGAIPLVTADQVGILEGRLDRLSSASENNPAAQPPSEEGLRTALQALRVATGQTLQQDDAVRKVDLEFRQYRRAYLGGSLKGWMKELANPSEDELRAAVLRATSSAGSPLLSLGGDTLAVLAKMLIGIIITVASLFFFLAEGEKMVNAVVRLSPLEEKYVRELVEEFVRVCRAVVTATLLSAVVQGLLAGLGFYFAGLHNSAALLMLLTMVFAMVPFTGAATVWVPVCLYLYFVEGHLTSAIGLAVYGTAVVSAADNFIKPMVLHGQSNLHPLLALLSVLGGIQALGPIGIVVGPMVVVFLQTTLKILQRELLSIDRVAAAAGVPLGPTTVTPPPPDPMPPASPPTKPSGKGKKA